MADSAYHKQMSREHILAAALKRIDREGLASLSQRKVAADLGIAQPSLYNYYPNKDALLDALVDGVIERVFSAATTGIAGAFGWKDQLRAYAVAFHDELIQHPNLVPLVATRPAMTPASLALGEQLAAWLVGLRFSPQRAFHIINLLSTFVIGHTLAEAGATPGHEDAPPDMDALRAQLDPATYPQFAAAVETGLGQPSDHQARFDFALDVLLTGIAAYAPKG